MTGLNRDDIIRMARETELLTTTEPNGYQVWIPENLERFAALVYAEGHKDGLDDFEAVVLPAAIKAEREKVAEWMMQRGYATGHGDTIDDLLAELDWQIAENWNRAMINGVKTERDTICVLLDRLADTYEDLDRQGSAEDIRKLIRHIRARGNDAT